jgi:hypothetical protein
MSNVSNILKANGLEAAPGRTRQTTGRTFSKAHWDESQATDFTTIEVWIESGLVTSNSL